MKIQLLISYSGTEKAGAKNGETVDITGRGERIWTSGLFVPNEARYQAAPHLDASYINDLVQPMIRDFHLLDATTWRYASFFDCKMEIMD